MDSLADQIIAWLRSQQRLPSGPLAPMSAGGVPMPGMAQPDQTQTLRGRLNVGPAPAPVAPAPAPINTIIGRRG